MNLFRGELVDRSLHYYFLSSVRREVSGRWKIHFRSRDFNCSVYGNYDCFDATAVLATLLLREPQILF